MRGLAFFLAAMLALPAAAQEPAGCDKFKWPLDKERAMLAAAIPAQMNATPVGAPYRLALTADAKLPMPPTRAARPGTNAGFVQLAAPPQAGAYRVTLSGPGWIDVFQSGRALKSGAFSGATGCPGIAKSVKFGLAGAPLLIEISGAPATTISFVITSDIKE
jgi:hypothetical protein